MSHFSKLKTKIKDRAALVAALEEMGFAGGAVEVHEKGTKLEGYEARGGATHTAEVVIRQKHLSGGYNDIGFKLGADGTYEALISDPQMMKANRNKLTEKLKGGFGKEWMDVLNQRYSFNVIKRQADDAGWALSEEYVDGELVVRAERSY